MDSETGALQSYQSPGVPSLQQNDTGELLLYWRSIYKRKWWIVGTALLFALIGVGVVSMITPTYRATVTLMIEQTKAKLVSIEEVYSGVSPNREHYQTQAEVLKSPALATRVIERLNLNSHPEFDPRQAKPAPWLSALGLGRATRVEWTESAVKDTVLNRFLNRITIEPVRLTQLVKVGFDAADPDLAMRVANAIADAYIDADVEVRAH